MDKEGLRKRPSYNEVVNEILIDKKIRLPDRRAKFMRDSPYLSFLDNETYLEVEDQENKKIINKQIEQAVQTISSNSSESASVLLSDVHSERALSHQYNIFSDTESSLSDIPDFDFEKDPQSFLKYAQHFTDKVNEQQRRANENVERLKNSLKTIREGGQQQEQEQEQEQDAPVYEQLVESDPSASASASASAPEPKTPAPKGGQLIYDEEGNITAGTARGLRDLGRDDLIDILKNKKHIFKEGEEEDTLKGGLSKESLMSLLKDYGVVVGTDKQLAKLKKEQTMAEAKEKPQAKTKAKSKAKTKQKPE